MTLVPLVSLVRSRVSPAGTVMSLRVMVEQEVLPLLAAAASVKVQEDARSSRGAAMLAPAPARSAVKRPVVRTILSDLWNVKVALMILKG